MDDFDRSIPLGRPPSGKSLFQIYGREYDWGQLVAFNEFTGRLDEQIKRLSWEIPWAEKAKQDGQEVDREILQTAADRLRYQLNLITTNETLDWLRYRDLTFDDFNNFLLRKYWAAHIPNQPAFDHLPPPSKETLNAALWEELHFTDTLVSITTPFIHHIMIHYDNLDDAHHQDEERQACVNHLYRPGAWYGDSSEALLSRHLFLHQGNVMEFVDLKLTFQKFSQRYAPLDKCRQFFNLNRINFIKLDYETVHYSALEPAREAFLCATEDDEPLLNVAARTGGGYHRCERFGEDLHDDYRQRLLSASAGDYLASPDDANLSKFWIAHVIRKTTPHEDDPEVVERIRRHLIAELLAPSLETQVSWLLTPQEQRQYA